MKKILNSKVLILFLLLSVCLPSSSFAKDEYGVVIDDGSNVCQLTLNENTIRYHKDCNSNASFSLDSGTGIWNAGNSSQVSFELDGIHDETTECATVFQNLINNLPGSGPTTCNFTWNKQENEYLCDHESEYSGVLTFSGGIVGCSDVSSGTYQWYQVCGIKNDVLDQADCYIGYTTDSEAYPTLNLVGDENTSKFYVCIGNSCSETEAQKNKNMEILASVKTVLNIFEIFLYLLLL